MKVNTTAALLTLVTVLYFSFIPAHKPNTNNQATVNQEQGLYLFTDCKPVNDYEFLGTVQGKSAMSISNEQYIDVRNLLIKRVKKEFPKADGIIFHFDNGGRDAADAIFFK